MRAPTLGGGGTGGANIRFCQKFPKKLHEIERILTPGGGLASLAPPLRSATGKGLNRGMSACSSFSSGSKGGRGDHAPPGPIIISHKKDGRQRRLHRFHVSRPPYPAAGSATVIQFAYCFPRHKLHKDLVMHKLVHSALFVFRRTLVQVYISFFAADVGFTGINSGSRHSIWRGTPSFLEICVPTATSTISCSWCYSVSYNRSVMPSCLAEV